MVFLNQNCVQTFNFRVTLILDTEIHMPMQTEVTKKIYSVLRAQIPLFLVTGGFIIFKSKLCSDI